LKAILNEKEFNQVFKEVEKYVPYMLELNEKLEVPGARILQQVAHEVLSYIRLQKHMHKKLQKKKVEEFIERAFKRRILEEAPAAEEGEPSQVEESPGPSQRPKYQTRPSRRPMSSSRANMPFSPSF
jgi:hypothetical protein